MHTCTIMWLHGHIYKIYVHVSFQPSATTSARDDECSSNGSDQINTKCGKTHQMCSRYFEYYLNTCHVVAA